MQIVHLFAQKTLALGQLVAVGLGVQVDVGLQPDQFFAQARKFVDDAVGFALEARQHVALLVFAGRVLREGLLQHPEFGVDLGQPAAAGLTGVHAARSSACAIRSSASR